MVPPTLPRVTQEGLQALMLEMQMSPTAPLDIADRIERDNPVVCAYLEGLVTRPMSDPRAAALYAGIFVYRLLELQSEIDNPPQSGQ